MIRVLEIGLFSVWVCGTLNWYTFGMKKSFSQLIAVNKEGKLLFQHRTSDAKRNPNKWDLFGGGMEDGETPEEALKRELVEELELPINNFKFYKMNTLIEDGVTKNRYYFLADINNSKEELKGKQHEGQNLDFFLPAEIKNLDLVPHHKEIIDGFIRELESGSNILH